MSGAQWNSTSGERLTGYRRALAAAGVAIDERLVACGESSIEPARLAVHALLALPDRPTAIVSGNNQMNLGAMRALKEAGVAITGEVAFAGFDDLDWADLHSPSLTVTAQPLEDIGARGEPADPAHEGAGRGAQRGAHARDHAHPPLVRLSLGCAYQHVGIAGALILLMTLREQLEGSMWHYSALSDAGKVAAFTRT